MDDPTPISEYSPDPQVEVPSMFYVSTTIGELSFLDGHNALVSAGTAWRNPGDGFNVYVPDVGDNHLFVDSGGFQATVHFEDHQYPYSPERLFEWASEIGADYVAGMDWACEEAHILAEDYDKLNADSIPDIDTRIKWTIEKQIEQYEVYKQGDYDFQFVPVVQGYSAEDYRYCAARLRQEGIANGYMGIGSVCKRDSTDQIFKVLQACQDELPRTDFHLFGATRKVWKDRRFWGQFASSDTHAWGASHPDGGFPSNKEEKVESFYYFHDAIEELVTQIDNQWQIGVEPSTFAEAFTKALENTNGMECICGTSIPPYGDDFEPGCRACESRKLNRGLKEITAVSERYAEKEGAKREIGLDRQSVIGDPAVSEPHSEPEDNVSESESNSDTDLDSEQSSDTSLTAFGD